MKKTKEGKKKKAAEGSKGQDDSINDSGKTKPSSTSLLSNFVSWRRVKINKVFDNLADALKQLF